MTIGRYRPITSYRNCNARFASVRISGATLIGGVPTVLLSLLENENWSSQPQYIKSISLGGSNVPEELMVRLMQKFKAPAVSVYGQSEAPMIAYPMPSDEPEDLIRTVGRPAPHVELKIRDPHTLEIVERGVVGEILIRGPLMMNGYYRAPEATADAFTPDGFLVTGDLGSLDERGFLTLKGRARDVIIRGGVNIYPAEIEAVLCEHPGVKSAAVVGIQDERMGQSVAAAIVPEPTCPFDPDELQNFVAERLAYFKVPKTWNFFNELPLTASGKVKKVELEAMFD